LSAAAPSAWNRLVAELHPDETVEIRPAMYQASRVGVLLRVVSAYRPAFVFAPTLEGAAASWLGWVDHVVPTPSPLDNE